MKNKTSLSEFHPLHRINHPFKRLTMTPQEKFLKPFDLKDRPDVYELMPKYRESPKVDYKWEKAVSTWFFNGIPKSAFKVKDGIDADKAFSHLSAIISSWLPKHEHKTEAAAFLMSLWFDDVKL